MIFSETNRLQSHWLDDLDETIEEAADDQHKASSRIHPVAQRVESFIEHHPVKALSLAVATGVLVGWLVKRK